MSQADRLPREEEFKEWLEHPATKALHRILRGWQSDLKEQWASGAFTDQSQFGTAISNAKAIGNCEVIERTLGLDYEQMLGESDDGSQH